LAIEQRETTEKMNRLRKVRVCVVTATRAEYGLLRPIIQMMEYDTDIDSSIVVTGMHLSPEFGLTYKEIENDGVLINKKIEILLSSDTGASISKSMGLALTGFADYFSDHAFDMVILLGDRYETLAVAIAAMNAGIPIAHLHGGEITIGAVDDAIRHAITKLSYLHFTSTEEYRKRVIQLGESPDRVFYVGALAIDNIEQEKLLSREELSEQLGIDLSGDYAVVTFHPTTLENDTAAYQVKELLEALSVFQDWHYVVTKANADKDGRVINKMLDEYAGAHTNVHVYSSLGTQRYLSALKYATAVIGNSSSGLLEAPSFHIPTVNIGDRQKGRVRADSVFDCKPIAADIIRCIKLVRSEETRSYVKTVENPYKCNRDGAGTTAHQIVSIIKEYVLGNRINLKKIFYDVQ